MLQFKMLGVGGSSLTPQNEIIWSLILVSKLTVQAKLSKLNTKLKGFYITLFFFFFLTEIGSCYVAQAGLSLPSSCLGFPVLGL